MAVNSSLTHKQGEIGFAAVLLIAAGLAFLKAGDYPGASGVYPRVMALGLGIGAVLVLLRSWLQTRPGDDAAFFGHLGRFLLGFAMLGLYILAIDAIGYVIPSLILGIALPVALRFADLRMTALASLGTLIFILVVFVVILKRPLPADILDPLLGVLR
ncbi:tripartite tricarboxylate transporter TctB family protein [Cypionkella sp.]|uniref:tripartite tricarboxylate transporter TctB family protein n=1 Tax=Cypionkella sp. TaxID=2811411 RepID=UPI002AB8C405|nr:tripartite tricarboxylate transporter TctB family protein [Cypionkella sp.]MDZ4395908.1 tripartite tricarboxylate transporter TctB family protein [Cypionkella sp.]